MKDIINIVNDINIAYLTTVVENMPIIKYDGLHCPKCHANTVTTQGTTWCPNILCDYGTPFQISNLSIKWSTT